jgi:hypothetical protein
LDQRARTILLVAGAAIVAVVLFIVLRPDDDGDDSASPTTTARSTTTAPTTTAPTTTVQGTQAQLVRVVYQGGRVIGGIRQVRLERGDVLMLVVASSVPDHVHVHGYDIMRDVGPGRPARITLRVTAAGRFEVELEDRKVQIAELDVRP